MPTISEYLLSLFDRDMRAVLRNPRAVCLIENPSRRVQLAAVRQDSNVICLIDRPAEDVQLAAVRKFPEAIHFIDSPTERVQSSVVRNNPGYISFLAHPTEKVQLLAVEKTPECISLIRQPTEKVQLVAVMKDVRNIERISNPTEKVKKLAGLEKDIRQDTAVPETQEAPSKSKSGNARKPPMNKATKEAAVTLENEMRSIGSTNSRLRQEASYADNADTERKEVAAANRQMDKELTAAFKKFNDSAVPEKAGCDVGKVIRDLRRSGVCVEENEADRMVFTDERKNAHGRFRKRQDLPDACKDTGRICPEGCKHGEQHEQTGQCGYVKKVNSLSSQFTCLLIYLKCLRVNK